MVGGRGDLGCQSNAYHGARLQAPRSPRERGVDAAVVLRLVDEHTTKRALGFMGAPAVSVLS
jgi:K+-transporting ATPase ATPase C chain